MGWVIWVKDKRQSTFAEATVDEEREKAKDKRQKAKVKMQNRDDRYEIALWAILGRSQIAGVD